MRVRNYESPRTRRHPRERRFPASRRLPDLCNRNWQRENTLLAMLPSYTDPATRTIAWSRRNPRTTSVEHTPGATHRRVPTSECPDFYQKTAGVVNQCSG